MIRWAFLVLGACSSKPAPSDPPVDPKLEQPRSGPPSAADRACQQNADCVTVQAGCCGCGGGGTNFVVNKTAAAKRVPATCGDVACPPKMSDTPECVGTPVCKAGTCEISLAAGDIPAPSTGDASVGDASVSVGDASVSVGDASVGDASVVDAGRAVTDRCQRDSDCVFVPSTCCTCNSGGHQIAVTKSRAKTRAPLRCPATVTCLAVLTPTPDCTGRPTCLAGTCVAGGGDQPPIDPEGAR